MSSIAVAQNGALVLPTVAKADAGIAGNKDTVETVKDAIALMDDLKQKLASGEPTKEVIGQLYGTLCGLEHSLTFGGSGNLKDQVGLREIVPALTDEAQAWHNGSLGDRVKLAYELGLHDPQAFLNARCATPEPQQVGDFAARLRSGLKDAA
jgi:hypothetical protein